MRTVLTQPAQRERADASLLSLMLAVCGTLLFWSSAFPAIKVALRSYSPLHLAAFRFMVAAGVFGIYLLVRRRPLPDRGDWPALFIMGFLGFSFYNVALNFGQQKVTAGAASFLINTVPIFSVILAVLLLGERLKPIGWLGVAISFTGASLLALGEGETGMLSRHAFYILAAAASASCCVILQKNYLRKYPAIDLTAYITIAAALQLLPFTIGLREEIASAPRVATLAVIYLGIIPAALAYSLWAFVLSHWPASRTVSFLYLAPALTCIISWFWLSEIPSNVSILGGIIALSGVVLVNTKGK